MTRIEQTSAGRYRFRLVIPSYPAFNIYSGVANKMTALGPVYVATSVNRLPGWNAEMIDENNLHGAAPRTPEGIDHGFLQRQRSAQVVGLYGGLTSTIPRLYAVARAYKEMGAITVAGGQHFVEENIDEALSSGIDYVVMGEGEETISELLSALTGSGELEKIRGIAYRSEGKTVRTGPRELLTDFERLPLPDFSLIRFARIKYYPVERIRGCGMECEFCTVKGKPRPASPERLIEQVSALVETRNARHFFVVDDLFGQQREETLRLCRMLYDYQQSAGIKLDFTVQIRLDKARDVELLAAMRKAGVVTVAIGFESPLKQDLDTMRKRLRQEDMIALARTFRRFGFLVHGMFIFGYPGEDRNANSMPIPERVRQYRRFIRKARIDTIQILHPVPLPGTLLRNRLQEQCRIYDRNQVGWEFYDGNFPLFEPDPPVTPEQLHAGARSIMGGFYRFRQLFMVGLHVLSFPGLLFWVLNLKAGWRRWYRNWRNSVVRYGGWLILKGWTSQLKKSAFSRKMQQARQDLSDGSRPRTAGL